MNNILYRYINDYVEEDFEDPDIDSRYLESLELYFLKKQINSNSIINFLKNDHKINSYDLSISFKLINEVALNLNFFAINDYWSYIASTIKPDKTKFRFFKNREYAKRASKYDLDSKLDILSFLLKFNDNRAFLVFQETIDTLPEINLITFLEDFFSINNSIAKKCIDLLIRKHKYKKLSISLCR